jgi:hypothetical protein
MSDPIELTDAELIVLKAMLEVLDRAETGLPTTGWQGFTEARLGGEHISAGDFDRLADLCRTRLYALAAPHPITKKPRWAITQQGRMALQQLQN